MIRSIFAFIFILLFASFVGVKKNKPKLPPEYVAIPAGTFWDKQGVSSERFVIPEFYISKFEVTNYRYREFLNAVRSDSVEINFANVIVDSSGWDENFSYGQPLVINYFKHPAYNDFPVVNIKYEGALAYCRWLQKKIQKENPDFIISVGLPSRIQWIYAATGGRNNSIYSWGGNYLRDKNGKFLCNFNYIDASAIFRDSATGKPEIKESEANEEHSFTTREVSAYYPNNFGLFNMCGNVAEMIDSFGVCMGGSWKDYGGDIRATSKGRYIKSSCAIGFRPIIIIKQVARQ